MKTEATTMIRLFRMPIRKDEDVVVCRNRARTTAGEFGFDRQDQIRIATAVSEIARNAFRYAKGASAEFFLETRGKTVTRRNPQQLVCIIRDEGPGIPHLNDVMAGTYRSPTGMGMGIVGAHRLMDSLDVETAPEGTVVRLTKELPRGKTVSPQQLQAASDTIMRPVATSPTEEVAVQDQDALFMMKEIVEKGEELARVNEELGETNRGVVALYDELDTVYRVGHVLASKLELNDLLQAIINATTDICDAEVGVFVYEEQGEEQNGTARVHFAGILSSSLQGAASLPLHRLLGSSARNPGILRIDDLDEENRVPAHLGESLHIRSYLAIPVATSEGIVTGAMVFAHRQPAMFSERSERILASVALQASVGIENARLYKDVQSASAAKDQFLAILSHELRNPLNPVFARLSLLEENPAMPKDALEDLALIRRDLELETRLIDDLLDMTRIARGKISLRIEPVDLHKVIQAAEHACSGYAKDQQVEVILKLEAPAFIVQGDGARLQQVFWNLLNNALKFSPPGSVVVVKTAGLNGRRIRVTVSDQGRGFDPSRMDAIFEPFEQESGKMGSQFGGLGLGLAICKNILTAHGGDIQGHSEGNGRGASFLVSLKLTDKDAGHLPSGQPERGSTAVRGLKILLVDDHKDTRSSLQTLLQRRGHTVATAANCAEARTLAGEQAFQLVISDIGLPDGTGYDLMRDLKRDHDLKGIAVSGYGMSADIRHSEEAGFSVHLIKPLKIPDLEKAIALIVTGLPG